MPKIKTISLVEPGPPSPHVFSKFKIPRLGTLILATMMRERGYDVNVYVEDINGIDYGRLFFGSDIVGISSITSTTPASYKLADMLDEVEKISQGKKKIPVVMGGPHVTFLPDEALEHADFVVRNEGEKTLIELVNALENAKGLEKIKGLSYKQNGKKIHNPDRPFLAGDELSEILIPDMTLIPNYEKSWHDRFRIIPLVLPIETGRGCGFGCKFCSVKNQFGKKSRTRANDIVVDAMKEYKDELAPFHGFFIDDNFALNKKRAKELLKDIIDKDATPERGLSAQVRVETARDSELLDLMKQTGMTTVYMGFESINPEALKEMKKGQTVQDIQRAIYEFGIRDISIHAMLVFGFDSNKLADFDRAKRFIEDNKLTENGSSIQALTLVPLPGTETHRELEQQGRIITKNYELYDGHHAVFEPKNMTAYELEEGTRSVMRDSYLLTKSLKHLLRGRIKDSAVNTAAWHYISKQGKQSENIRWREALKEIGQLEDRKSREIFRRSSTA